MKETVPNEGNGAESGITQGSGCRLFSRTDLRDVPRV